MMKMHYAVPMALLALGVFGATPALAQDGEVDDVMMSVVDGENTDEEEFTGAIELPTVEETSEDAAHGLETANENAAFGLETANEARKLRDMEGDRSEAARSLGRDAAEVNADDVADGDGRPGAR